MRIMAVLVVALLLNAANAGWWKDLTTIHVSVSDVDKMREAAQDVLNSLKDPASDLRKAIEAASNAAGQSVEHFTESLQAVATTIAKESQGWRNEIGALKADAKAQMEEFRRLLLLAGPAIAARYDKALALMDRVVTETKHAFDDVMAFAVVVISVMLVGWIWAADPEGCKRLLANEHLWNVPLLLLAVACAMSLVPNDASIPVPTFVWVGVQSLAFVCAGIALVATVAQRALNGSLGADGSWMIFAPSLLTGLATVVLANRLGFMVILLLSVATALGLFIPFTVRFSNRHVPSWDWRLVAAATTFAIIVLALAIALPMAVQQGRNAVEENTMRMHARIDPLIETISHQKQLHASLLAKFNALRSAHMTTKEKLDKFEVIARRDHTNLRNDFEKLKTKFFQFEKIARRDHNNLRNDFENSRH